MNGKSLWLAAAIAGALIVTMTARAEARKAPRQKKAPPVEKVAMPEAAAVLKARKGFEEAMAGEMQRARTPTEKTALAKMLLQTAVQTRDDPPARRALTELAGEIAAAAGDVETAFAAAEEMDKAFVVDSLKVKVDAAARLAKAANADADALGERAEGLADQAVAADRYDVARKAADVAAASARRSGDRAAVQAAATRLQAIKAIEAGYVQAEKARAILAKDPDNAGARLAVGRFLCFLKGDWEKGLAMLAAGSDKGLRELAGRELAAPASGPGLAQAADAWWEAAGKERGMEQQAAREHAAALYARALPALTGVAKLKAQMRIGEVRGTAGGLEDWGVYTWDGKLWRSQPVGKMTVEPRRRGIRATNTTGIHEVSLLYRRELLGHDFAISFECRGSGRFIVLPGDARDVSFHSDPVAATDWTSVTFTRQRGRIAARVNQATLEMRGDPATAAGPCRFMFQLLANETIEVRGFTLTEQ